MIAWHKTFWDDLRGDREVLEDHRGRYYTDQWGNHVREWLAREVHPDLVTDRARQLARRAA